ncbi:MAG: hypothetical protein PHO89_11205 [Methylacidiphilaceae bacterium]|nr:hypothetical protein [Candidatus Methylacidiphilaceae bacterium]
MNNSTPSFWVWMSLYIVTGGCVIIGTSVWQGSDLIQEKTLALCELCIPILVTLCVLIRGWNQKWICLVVPIVLFVGMVLRMMPNNVASVYVINASVFAAFMPILYSIAIMHFIAHLLFGLHLPGYVDRLSIEKRWVNARNEIYISASLLSGILLVFGFIVRALRLFSLNIGLSPSNVPENVAFAGFALSVIIVPTALLLYLAMVHGHDVAIKILQSMDGTAWFGDKDKDNYSKLKLVIRDAWMYINYVARPRDGKGPLEGSDFGLVWRFLRRVDNAFFCSVVVALGISGVMVWLLLYLFSLAVTFERWVAVWAIVTTIAFDLAGVAILRVIPSWRIGAWVLGMVNIVIVSAFPVCAYIAADYIPQQFGGFRSEWYIASWNGKAGKSIIRDDRYWASPPPPPGAPAGPGSEDAVMVKVRYRSEKYLYLAPMSETKAQGGNAAPQKGEEVLPCIMVSTEGLAAISHEGRPKREARKRVKSIGKAAFPWYKVR